ncbi:hypothetical protein Y032_0156g3137 [Ancylostoma ceylanicum]|uniref:Uncharacterized protein n=1 Tax=Ancylostoma ceylanicum TaxID=53326 RepID=A0A016SZL6_9BILA|nr:hypothetical protein Y032_0156g3137 [Ancylostoma ceylanicum]
MQSKTETIGRCCEQGWRPCVETSYKNPREATGNLPSLKEERRTLQSTVVANCYGALPDHLMYLLLYWCDLKRQMGWLI